MDFYQENQLTQEEQLKAFQYKINDSSNQVKKNQDKNKLKLNFQQYFEKNNIEKPINDKNQLDLQMNNNQFPTHQFADILDSKGLSTHNLYTQRIKDQSQQPYTNYFDSIQQQIPFYAHVNKMINCSIEEEEKQQQLDIQQDNYRDDISSSVKTKLLLDSESTQPTQKLQIDQQQDQDRQYQKSFDEATFLKNQANQSYKQSKYGKAIEQYNLALGLCDPQYLVRCPQQLFGEFQKLRISIILHLSSCYIYIRNFKQCIDILNIAIQLDPLNPKVWYKRSTAHQLQFNYEDAYRDIEQAWNLVKTTTQDPYIFNKRKDILNQIDTQHSQQLISHGKYNKPNYIESMKEFQQTNSIASTMILGNRNKNYSSIIFKITASSILASCMTQYLLKEKLSSKYGFLQAFTISLTTATCMIAEKKWQQYTFATITLGILVMGLNRKRGV